MAFQFPGTYAELRDHHFSEQYKVKSKNIINTMDERLILIKVNQYADGFNASDQIIEDHAYFDYLYYLVEYLDQHPNVKIQLQLIDILANQITKLCRESQHVQSFKMVLFLLLNLMQQKSLQGIQIKKALKSLQSVFNSPLLVHVGREGSRYFYDLVKMAIDLKEQQTKDLWVQILLQSLIQWSEFDQNLRNRVAHLMYESENIVMPIVQLLSATYRDERTKTYTIEQVTLLVNYITEKSTNQVESIAVKNLKELLMQSSRQIPKLYYQQLSGFIHLYDNENYHIRNALNEVITSIVEYLIKQDNTMGSNESNIDKLIKQLAERQQDKTALSRSNVLQCLTYLLNTNCMPKQYLQIIFAIASSRLRDVSGYVRKAALQLIKSIVKYYRLLFVQSQGKQTFWNLIQTNQMMQINRDELELIHKDFQQMDAQAQEGLLSQEELAEEVKQLKKKTEELVKQLACLDEYKQFIESMKTVITQVLQLCQSKNQADVIHSIKLFSYLKKYEYEDASVGIKRMLLLIWAQDKAISQEVAKKFYKLFLRDSKQLNRIVNNLLQLIESCMLKEVISIEKILAQYTEESAYKLPSKLFSVVWNSLDVHPIPNSMLTLLRILIVQQPKQLTQDRCQYLHGVLHRYASNDSVDFINVQSIAAILDSADQRNQAMQDIISNSVTLLTQMLIKSQGSSDTRYYSASDSIVSLISQQPQSEEYYEQLIKNMSEQILADNQMEIEGQDNTKFTHLIYIVGTIALKMLIHIDTVHTQVKLIRNAQEKKQEKEQEIDKISGGSEAEYERMHELLTRIQDHSIIQQNMLSKFAPIVKGLVEGVLGGIEQEINTKECQSPLIQVSLLTMCKFMCLSEQYCKDNIQLLFQIMKSPQVDQVMKNNVIISIGDLLHRWPNTIQKFHKQIYSNISDTNSQVRRVTLLVLTHLILNDMIKSRSSLQHIPKLLCDPNPVIPPMARYFLNELTKKDQRGITNALPDILANANEYGELILPQIVQYIDKGQSDSIVDRLITVIASSQDILEVRNIALMFSLLTFKQSSFQKLLDGWEEYRTKLSDSFVLTQFHNLIKKLRRTLPAECKAMIDDLENKIEHHDKETFENRRREKPSKKRAVHKDKENNTNNTHQAQEQAPVVRAKRNPKKKEQIEVESDSDSGQIELEDDEYSEVIHKTNNNRRKRPVVESD